MFTVGIVKAAGEACGDVVTTAPPFMQAVWGASAPPRSPPRWVVLLCRFSFSSQLETRLHQRLFDPLAPKLVPSSKRFQKCSSGDTKPQRSGSRGRKRPNRACCLIRKVKSWWRGVCWKLPLMPCSTSSSINVPLTAWLSGKSFFFSLSH